MKISYPVARALSVWVGNFPTEEVFDKTIDAEITSRLSLPTEIED